MAKVRSRGYQVPLFGKLECENGEKTNPLFRYLKHNVSVGLLGTSIKWNFTKYLCDSTGKPLHRFGPQDSPLSFESTIRIMLEKEGNTLPKE